MPVSAEPAVSRLVERRYLGLVELVRMVSLARDWKELARGISQGLERAFADEPESALAVRVWAITDDGFEESARYPAEHDFVLRSPRELRRAAGIAEPIETATGGVLVGLHAGGVSFGVLDIDCPAADSELLAHAAPVIATRVSLLAGQGIGDILLAPVAIESTSDVAPLMATFALEAERQLSHDRLSAYLLTCQGRAFERFAVATSPIVPGEGVIIPFEDLGLRHVVITNRGLVSADLATDPRVVGREDRVIAAAGFHGLLSVPLRVAGRPIGVLNFVSRTPGFYREEDIPVGQQIADQVAAFIDNLHAQQQMRALLKHEAAERERARVGRDVYHVVAQNIPSIAQLAQEIERGLAASKPSVSPQLAQVRDLAERTLYDVRRAIAGLLPRDLDTMTLEEAARATLAQVEDGELKTRLDVTGDTSLISAAARRAACRIMQEAITNVRLHAEASRLTVSIDCDRDLTLTIADDGVGFDPEHLEERAGMGIDHMLDRARALGGVLTVDSSPGAGTRISFELLGVGDADDSVSSATSHQDEVTAHAAATVRVLIIDRHPLMRAGLLHIAESVPDVRVVAQAGSISEARAQLRRVRPDVVLLDGHMVPSDAEQLIREIRNDLPLARIVVTFESSTGHEAALAEAGASRFVSKTADAGQLIDAIRTAASGDVVLPAELPAAVERGTLSARERSILLLMAGGHTNVEIGQQLFLATKTVERQVATIVHKLGARNRAHAVALAVARRLVDPDQAAVEPADVLMP
jgi:signal transduction histidine kinase/DNA-binding NarL/FixJ family response regulator